MVFLLECAFLSCDLNFAIIAFLTNFYFLVLQFYSNIFIHWFLYQSISRFLEQAIYHSEEKRPYRWKISKLFSRKFKVLKVFNLSFLWHIIMSYLQPYGIRWTSHDHLSGSKYIRKCIWERSVLRQVIKNKPMSAR